VRNFLKFLQKFGIQILAEKIFEVFTLKNSILWPKFADLKKNLFHYLKIRRRSFDYLRPVDPTMKSFDSGGVKI